MISGTKNVGSRLSGNVRNAVIDSQSCNPKRSALKTTKMMSMKPKKFQMRRVPREARNVGAAIKTTAPMATIMSPIPAGRAKPSGKRPCAPKMRK